MFLSGHALPRLTEMDKKVAEMHSEMELVVDKIVAAGGKQRMPIREYYPGEKPYRMVYVEDPFCVVFEIYSHSYELTYSAGAY